MLKLKQLRVYLALTVLAVVAVFTILPLANAAEPKDGQGLEISPPLVERSVDPGDTFKLEVKLRNVTSNPLLVSAVVNDFLAKGEEGQPQLLLDQTITEEGPYSMRNWVAPLPKANLSAGAQKVYDVTVKVPKDASPGGHYGAIRFSGSPKTSQLNPVSLTASISNLILIEVSGDVKTAAGIEELYIGKKVANGNVERGNFFAAGPLTIVERIRNSGNMHIKPEGSLRITNIFGQEIAKLDVNQSGGNILPDSIRRFEQSLEKKHLFGHYKATLELKYADNQTLVGSISFWILPYPLIALVLAGLALVVGLVVLWLRSYKKRILNNKAAH